MAFNHRSSLALFLLYPCLAYASLPLVDFNRMGKVGLAGAFAGLSLIGNSTVSFDSSTSTLLSRSSDGSLTRLGSTNAGGNIVAGCSLGDTYYVAGTFSSIGGVDAINIASYSSGVFAALDSKGPSNGLYALYCDEKNGKVWVGGESVAVWTPSASSWSQPPFGSLSGEVLSITTNASQSSLFFSGNFITAFGNGTQVVNGTNNPNVPFSSGATPYSSSLVPVPLGNAQIDAAPSSSQSGFSNIQNVLCPAGADGAGNTWFGQDGNKAVVTVRKFAFLSASGLRLGNTFVDGRSTTGFSITTIPDNSVRTLHYTNPTTGQNQTCTDPCPLLTDPNVPYQDFLFDEPLDITGYQLTLSQWNGQGPGLHLMQLLSSGAFASSITDDNSQSCFAPNPSNTSYTGNWVVKQANTDIPGTTQSVLVSTVDVGTPSSQSPTFTWMPYVSASGDYTVNLLVPGCTEFQDCALRTSAQVTVFPGGGLAPFVKTISQQNQADSMIQIYQGPIVPSSLTFSMTITMALASQPEGTGQAGKYVLVADRVELLLNSANVTGTVTSGGLNGTAGVQMGFGLFEWPLDGQAAGNSSLLPQSSITSLDKIGFDLLNALGGSSNIQLRDSSVTAVAHHPSGPVFLAGSFVLTSGSASGASNIVVYRNGQFDVASNNGLNGPVSSMVLEGDRLIVGGSFNDTASASAQGKLAGIAIYDVQQNQWEPLSAGLDGPVTSLSVSDGLILAAGNFTTAVGTTSDGTAGFAIWNISSGAWVSSGGFLVGKMTFIGNGTNSEQSMGGFLAGHVASSFEYGASGFVSLQNGDSSDGTPQVIPLTSRFHTPINSSTSTSLMKRHYSHHYHSSVSWISTLNSLFRRQSTPTLAPLPTNVPATAPVILTGVYWSNTSLSREVVILGGNFSFQTPNGLAQNIVVYDPEADTISPLQGNQANGTVRTLLVQGDQLFIGGNLVVQGTNFDGFAVYSLANRQWDVTGSQPLQGASSSSSTNVVVRSITSSPSQKSVILVAGSFTQAGSVTCRAVCSYDIQSKQWSALGNGIQGEVATVAYAGSSRDLIVLAGSIALADGTMASVAQFALSNSSWSAVGDSNQLPGPVTAMEVNNGNASSIFAAGRSTNGELSFLSFWNGQTWSAVGSSFAGTTEVSQLTMVPLQNTHSSNGVIESDRMLWISGALSDPAFGNASSALFDGERIIPYIASVSSSGNPGTIASLIYSFSSFSFAQRHFLATGVVILISIAIAAGVVFLLALIGLLWTLFARRDDKLEKFDPADIDDDDSTSHRPSSLLEHINAATRTTILGASPFGPHGEKDADPDVPIRSAASTDPFGPDASNYVRAETPSDAVGGALGEEASRSAHARYSFEGTGEGELPLNNGQEVEILDDGDAAWWYARDPRTGQEGVVPAAYVY